MSGPEALALVTSFIAGYTIREILEPVKKRFKGKKKVVDFNDRMVERMRG